MADARLRVILDLIDRASAPLGAASDSVKGFSDSLRANIGTVLGVGAAITGAAITLRSFANAALEQERAMRLLSTVIENTGTSFATVREQVEATTSALMRKTAVADEVQIRTLAVLVAQTRDYGKAMAALPAVLDLAALTQQDVESAARVLGPALTGVTNTVRGMGIEFKQTQDFASRLAQTMDTVGGSAEAMKDPLSEISVQMGELKEQIGKAALPMVKALAAGFRELNTAIEDVSKPRAERESFLAGVAENLRSVMAAMIGVKVEPEVIGRLRVISTTQVEVAEDFSARVRDLGEAAKATANEFINLEGSISEWDAAAIKASVAAALAASEIEKMDAATHAANRGWQEAAENVQMLSQEFGIVTEKTDAWRMELMPLTDQILRLKVAISELNLTLADEIRLEAAAGQQRRQFIPSVTPQTATGGGGGLSSTVAFGLPIDEASIRAYAEAVGITIDEAKRRLGLLPPLPKTDRRKVVPTGADGGMNFNVTLQIDSRTVADVLGALAERDEQVRSS